MRRSHQADLAAGSRGIGDAIKKNERPPHSQLIDSHTKTSMRNFSDHRHLCRAADIWVLAAVEPTYTFLGSACKAKNICGGKQIPQGLQMAGATNPRDLAETAYACLALSRGGLAALEPSACFLQAVNSRERSE